MSRKMRKWIAFGLIALILAAIILWFFSPGIHLLWFFAHMNAEKKCYLLDVREGTILKETTIRFECSANTLTGAFNGTILIPEYPVQYTIGGSATKVGDCLRIDYWGYKMMLEEGDLNQTVDPGYRVFVYNANNICAFIIQTGASHVAVCADSREEAVKKGRSYIECYFGVMPEW